MLDEEFENIWKPVQSVIDHTKMGYDGAIVIGGAFAQMKREIKQLKEGMGIFIKIASIAEEKCVVQEQEIKLLEDWRSHLKNTLEHIEKLETDKAALIKGIQTISRMSEASDTPLTKMLAMDEHARKCLTQINP